MSILLTPTLGDVLAPVLSAAREQGHAPQPVHVDIPRFTLCCRECGGRVTGTATLDESNEPEVEVVYDGLTVNPCNGRRT